MSDLNGLQAELTGWLFDKALPLWLERGVDAASGAFQEALGQDGRPPALPRRARVQARQTYVYCWAGSRGFKGDWAGAATGGLDYFLTRHRRPDGAFRTLTAADGSPADDAVIVYDQAFALFALAAAATHLPARAEAAPATARAVLDVLAVRRAAVGGFIETGAQPHQSNCHMHLLEAALAWESVSDHPEWSALADEIGELALLHFIDAEGGYLREFFAADWAPAAGLDGRIVEPGHQFEWAWLLDRWGERRGHARARSAARTLYRIGADHGIDPRGVALDQLTDDLKPLGSGARLWPQTERLRAALRFGDEAGALEAGKVLLTYLATPVTGLWRDKLRPDGSFVEEPAPASSLYHIVGAVDALMDI